MAIALGATPRGWQGLTLHIRSTATVFAAFPTGKLRGFCLETLTFYNDDQFLLNKYKDSFRGFVK